MAVVVVQIMVVPAAPVVVATFVLMGPAVQAVVRLTEAPVAPEPAPMAVRRAVPVAVIPVAAVVVGLPVAVLVAAAVDMAMPVAPVLWARAVTTVLTTAAVAAAVMVVEVEVVITAVEEQAQANAQRVVVVVVRHGLRLL